MTSDWPVAELDQVRRMRILAASLPGVLFAEDYIDVPFDRVWAYVNDVETSIPALITDVRSFRVVSRGTVTGPATAEDGAGLEVEERLKAKAVGLLGNRGAFDVVLKSGWCLMQSRLVIGGLAATPEGEGTRFAGCGGLRFPGGRILVRAVGSRGGANRIITRLRAELG
jgi:hypothetical protein